MVTLTTDSGKVLAKSHAVQPKGDLQLLSGIKIAHLALKHRLGKNHKTRIVVFVGSPIEAEEKELVKIAKKLKKEKVNVDIVSFGEDELNKDLLQKFIETVNGRDGSGSHLVTIPVGPHLSGKKYICRYFVLFKFCEMRNSNHHILREIVVPKDGRFLKNLSKKF